MIVIIAIVIQLFVLEYMTVDIFFVSFSCTADVKACSLYTVQYSLSLLQVMY